MKTTLRASGLARVMKCAGFVSYLDLPEYESGLPAAEGTAAGEYLQAMLEQRTLTPQVPTHAKNGVRFDEDMIFHTTPIAEDILNSSDGPVLCEMEVVIPGAISVIGHSDVSYTRGTTLYIEDLKYGWGLIEVKENWQLLAYAIGEVIRRQQHFHNIVMRIRQPRPHHEDGDKREWVISYNELMSYYNDLQTRMNWIAAGARELSTGKQCKYCPAASHACPAFNRDYQDAIATVLNDFKQDDLSEKEIAFQLNQLDRVQEILKIKKDSMEALANYKMKAGGIIPGWTTEQNFGHRKWKSNVTPEGIAMLTGKNIIKPAMLSPAEAEKLGVSKHLVKDYVERHFTGMKLVRKDASKIADQIFGNGTV